MRYSSAVRGLYFRLARGVRAFQNHDLNEFFPIYICGVMGSGTTLITRLIEQHYIVGGVANETARNMSRRSPLRIRKSHRYGNIREFTKDLFLPEECSRELIRRHSVKFYRGTLRLGAESSIIVDKSPAAHLVRARHLRDAFPDSRFVLIIRDPWSSVEGLRRKWSLFARASLEEVCDFWRSLHLAFIRDTEPFRHDVTGVLLDNLVRHPERALERVEKLVPGLRVRPEIKPYRDRPNREGFGVRNVIDGRIVLVKHVSQHATSRLDEAEREIVRGRLWPVYERLHQVFGLERLEDALSYGGDLPSRARWESEVPGAPS